MKKKCTIRIWLGVLYQFAVYNNYKQDNSTIITLNMTQKTIAIKKPVCNSYLTISICNVQQ